MVHQGSRLPAKAVVLSQPQGVGGCDGSGHLLPTPSNISAPTPPAVSSPSPNGGSLGNLIASHLLRSCLTSNLSLWHFDKCKVSPS